jgi:ADP-ribosylglycohydrolase
MSGGGLGPYEPGEWSDDTQMALCIAQVAATGADLSEPKGLDLVSERFLDWLHHGASDVGNLTRVVLRDAGRRTGPAGKRCTEAAKAYLQAHPRGSAGNGALMRAGIVGLTRLRDRRATAAAARAVAALTHADWLAGDSCVLWGEAVRVAVLQGQFDLLGGLDLLPEERRERWQSWIEAATNSEPAQFAGNGFTVTALQAAWSAITQV